jgi:ABC-type phosphate transport system substrate-binding protein
MALYRRQFLLACGAALLSSARRLAAAGAESLVIIVHPQNPCEPLGMDDLESIFTTTRRFWVASTPIVAFNLPPRSAPRVEFDQTILGLDPDGVGRFWIDRRVRGGQPPPRVAPDAGTLVQIVANLKNAISYVPASAANASVRVVGRIDGRLLPP